MLWTTKPINTKAFEYYPALTKIRKHFEDNYFEPIDSARAASIVCLEIKHFSKFFRSKIGIGFKEWTDFVRIEKAINAIRMMHALSPTLL